MLHNAALIKAGHASALLGRHNQQDSRQLLRFLADYVAHRQAAGRFQQHHLARGLHMAFLRRLLLEGCSCCAHLKVCPGKLAACQCKGECYRKGLLCEWEQVFGETAVEGR